MAHELTIVMAIISLVIASFIIIQWPYVFANVKAETDLSRYGVATYAEYVKKGFIELLRVSAFIYVLLWLGLTALRQKATKSKALYIFQWIVLGEFLIILISIARRVYLYQLYHGLTLIRVYGSFFLVWLTCMAITLAIRHLTHKIRFGYLEGAITIILFVVLGTWNVEGYIVTTHPPTVNKRTDYVYLSRMSADGAKGWVMAYAHAKQIIEKYSLTTGEIDKNGRREIAYAEYILRQMTNKEYEYMGKYASPAEMKTYIGALVDFQTERFEKERVDLLAYIKKQPTDTWTKDRLVEIEKLKKEVNKINSQSLTNSNKSPIDNAQITDIVVNWWQQTIKPFEAASSPFFESFYDTSAAPQYYGPPDQSSLMENGNIATRYVKTSTLDRLFMKNRSDMKAFTLMKQAMPIAQLHSLQTMYYQLYDRIAQQSARDFETDISLESPLL